MLAVGAEKVTARGGVGETEALHTPLTQSSSDQSCHLNSGALWGCTPLTCSQWPPQPDSCIGEGLGPEFPGVSQHTQSRLPLHLECVGAGVGGSEREREQVPFHWCISYLKTHPPPSVWACSPVPFPCSSQTIPKADPRGRRCWAPQLGVGPEGRGWGQWGQWVQLPPGRLSDPSMSPPPPRPDLAQLRKKFEEDKQRIELMRAQRKFRPY